MAHLLNRYGRENRGIGQRPGIEAGQGVKRFLGMRGWQISGESQGHWVFSELPPSSMAT